jgi:ribosomal protein L2
MYSKTSLKVKTLKLKINNNFRSYFIGFVSTFVLTPPNNKLLALVFFNTGAASYTPSTVTFTNLMFFYLSKQSKVGRYFFKKPVLTFLFLLPRMSKVSNIELLPLRGGQYVRSSGTKAILINNDFSATYSLLKLPSGVKKLFSLFSVVYNSQTSLPDKKKTGSNRAGF